MTRGYLRLRPGVRDSASMIGAKSVPALASTYSTPRSARRARKDSAVMREAVSVTGSSLGWQAIAEDGGEVAPSYHTPGPPRLWSRSVGARATMSAAPMTMGMKAAAGTSVASQASPLTIGTITAHE